MIDFVLCRLKERKEEEERRLAEERERITKELEEKRLKAISHNEESVGRE